MYEQYKYGWRNNTTGYRLLQDNITGTATTVTGLVPGKEYVLAVTAVDAAGNESLRSNLVSTTALKAPTIYYYTGATTSGPMTVIATRAMGFSVYATGVPKPTLAMLSGPQGLTFDPATGAVLWTPSDGQVGTHTAIFRATNSVGSADVTAQITVLPNLPLPSSSFTYFGVTHSAPFAVEGESFDLRLLESYSNSTITWSVVGGPAGLSVEPTTGVVTWVPAAADVGSGSATFRATNYAGSRDLTVNFTVHPLGTDLRPPTPVSGIVVSVIDSNRAAVTWAPATDNNGVESYRITSYYTTGVGRFRHTVRNVFTAAGDTTMFEMSGLSTRTQNLYIQAIDAAGNVSPVGQSVTFTPVANPLFPSIKLANPLPINVVVGDALQIQLADTNPTDRTYSLLAAPSGAVIDPATGLITWNPAYANVGNATFTVRATNEFGYRDLTFTFPVAFTGPTQVTSYIRTGGFGATVRWTPPADTTHVVGYLVFQEWRVNGHTYSHTYRVDSPTATSLDGVFIVGGPVSHRIRVAAIDANGNVGLAAFPWVYLT